MDDDPWREGGTAHLRRGWLARLRYQGIVEISSWCGVVFAMVMLGDATTGGEYMAITVFGLLMVGCRLAIATEWLLADEQGVRWRSLFRRYSVPWADVADLGVGQIALLPSPVSIEVLCVHRGARRPKKIRPSVAVGHDAASEWLAGAQRLWENRQRPR
jgi:hypothetical protein